MQDDIRNAILENQPHFGLDLSAEAIEGLGEHYRLVQEHNGLLHLVAPCSPAEFAIRHILESLTLLRHLPQGASLTDIGPGGGFPSIPCLIVRSDLRAVLIESKKRKADLLVTISLQLSIADRVTVMNTAFEETAKLDTDRVVCRALDRFSYKIPKILKRADGVPFLFFGGENIESELSRQGRQFEKELMPLSDNRYLFIENTGLK